MTDPPGRARDGLRRSLDRLLQGLTALVLLAGVAGLVWEYGYGVSAAGAPRFHRLHLWVVLLFILVKGLRILTAAAPRQYLRSRWLDYTLIFVLGVQFAVYAGLQRTPEFRFLRETGQLGTLAVIYLAVLQIGLLAAFALRSTYFHQALIRLRLRPAQSLALSYLAAIAAGTLLLMLPKAGAEGTPLTPLEAAFTAVSAVSVTGLSVIEPGVRLSILGQWVLLALIQVGGLGILTLTALLAELSGGAVPRERAALARALDADRVEQLGSLVRGVAALTVIIELIGAAALYLAWDRALPGPLLRAHHALFHSVSSFCNAGFALFPGNLERFAGDAPVSLTLMALITAGGLGFGVLRLVLRRGGQAMAGLATDRLTGHARVVLGVSAALIVAGTLLFWLLERNGALAGLAPAERWLAAAFQSVTLRTAGFNTIPLAGIGSITIVLCMLWMMIGGSPGSTAGGCRTTTAAALASGLTRGRTFGVSISRETRLAAARLAGVYLAVFAVATVLLWLAEGRASATLAFESMSALGTVGLSLGETTRLGTPALAVLMVTMVIGRIGPLAVAVALLERAHFGTRTAGGGAADQPRLG